MAVSADAAEFGRLMRDLSAGGPMERRLLKEIRAGLKESGDGIVSNIKSTVTQPPPGGGRRSVGVRRALAAGTSLKVSASQGKPGVRIVTSASKLPPERRVMLRLYNKESWRHPVFASYRRRKVSTKGTKGDLRSALRGLNAALAERDRAKATWVTQQGRPYFGKVIESDKERVRKAVEDATSRAADALARHSL